MTRVVWDAPGERTYEYGVDRGVFYPKTGSGVPWNGLRSIEEKPVGGEVSKFYIDGEKVSQTVDSEEFTATLTAFTYPDEFAECDGTVAVGRGLYVTAQDRKMFDLAYRTKIGNDTKGSEFAYRIHLVFNAIATPTVRNNGSNEGAAKPTDLAWTIETMPISLPNRRPSAHLYIDSTTMDRYILQEIEEILYGNAITEPRMLTPAELIKFFRDAKTLTVTDNGDGSWTAEGPDDIIQLLSWYEYQIDWPSAIAISDTEYTLESL